MVRFGFSVGLLGMIGAFAFGCSWGDGEPAAFSAVGSSKPSAGGGAPSYDQLSQDVGRVLVVGNSDAVPLTEREYRGIRTPGTSGTDYVACRWESESIGLAVVIEAGQAGAALPTVSARIHVPSAAVSELDFADPAAHDQHVRVRLGSGDAFRFYEYTLGVDPATQQHSSCHVSISEIDDQRVSGVAACRALVATFSSLAATGPGDTGRARGSAAASIAFSCPFRTLSDPASGGSSSGGTSSAGGAPTSGGTVNGGSGGSGGAGGSAGTTGGAGGSVATKQCTGVATPCSLRSDAQCQFGTGCTLDEDCEGLSFSCYSQFGQFACAAQQGCYWSSITKSCAGSAWSCSSFSGSASCVSQEGCSWSTDCTGVPSSCSLLSEASCIAQPGCRWE